ncbi:MAG: methyltransferase domain-containing protein [Ruminococcus flavefaciens]|nr:methyltransferase domain-containing protein [Ruminococcus flavefaciens]MCM1229079.1 methyltransferase domain-containing protein [Ruminococcus flavefaciens]
MSVFICPVCGEKLGISGKSYVCPKNHSFDMAKSGYVNLLLAKHGAVHGDNKFMLRARREFLEKGYYSPLCESVCRTVAEYSENGGILLDAGCGEGYYTSAVRAENPALEMYGIDISKEAVEMASKRKSDINFAVASVFHIPVQAESCDILLTMFAPYCGEEYRRVLKSDGTMIMAIPSENHLWELKKAVYDTPYRNEVKPYELDGFRHIGAERVSFTMKIDNSTDIQRLFSMTPYYYRTGKTEQERLNNLDFLETQADFEILTYKKIAKD